MSNSSSEMNKFDLIVVGAGSAGLACARKAASLYKKKVALVERHLVGGTCVNVGCVPKKLNYNAAFIFTTIKNYAPGYCIQTSSSSLKFDWTEFSRRRRRHVQKINNIYNQKLKEANVVLINGEASLDLKSKQVIVNIHNNETNTINSKVYEADHIVLATGSAPSIPKETSGWQLGSVSDDIFNTLDQQPRKVAIIGSGYVAVETACMFRALGSEVSVFCRDGRILTRFDQEIACRLTAMMRDHQGINLVSKCSVTQLSRDSATNKITVHTTCQGEHSGFDFCLWAIGRHAIIPPLKEKRQTLELDQRGFIRVDEYQNTTAPGVYAVGDVTGRWMLTPVAIAAGRKLADRLFGNISDSRVNYELIPSVVFGHPPLGTVGLSEEEARSQNIPIVVYRNEFVNLFEAFRNYRNDVEEEEDERERTFYKIICHQDTQRILGAHLLGLGSDEIMQCFAVAIKLGLTFADLQEGFVGIHPTAAEELLLMP